MNQAPDPPPKVKKTVITPRQRELARRLVQNPSEPAVHALSAVGYSKSVAKHHATEVLASAGLKAALQQLGFIIEDKDAAAVGKLLEMFEAKKSSKFGLEPDNAVQLAACVKWLEIRGMAGKDAETVKQTIAAIMEIQRGAVMLFVPIDKREDYLSYFADKLQGTEQ